jgi:hypothetical protein
MCDRNAIVNSWGRACSVPIVGAVCIAQLLNGALYSVSQRRLAASITSQTIRNQGQLPSLLVPPRRRHPRPSKRFENHRTRLSASIGIPSRIESHCGKPVLWPDLNEEKVWLFAIQDRTRPDRIVDPQGGDGGLFPRKFDSSQILRKLRDCRIARCV